MSNEDRLKIFICWSGDSSKKIAQEVHNFLFKVFDGAADVFYSENIPAGTRWEEYLSAELRVTDFGILCLTPNNLSSSWLHFEAGALSKQKDRSLVVPLLFEVNHGDVRSPLSIFMGLRADNHEGIRSLLEKINESLEPTRKRSRKRLDIAVEEWKEVNDTCKLSVKKHIKKQPQENNLSKPTGKVATILDEILGLTRGIKNELTLIKDDLHDAKEQINNIDSAQKTQKDTVDKVASEISRTRDELITLRNLNSYLAEQDSDNVAKRGYHKGNLEASLYSALTPSRVARQLIDSDVDASQRLWISMNESSEIDLDSLPIRILEWVTNEWPKSKLEEVKKLLNECPDESDWYISLMNEVIKQVPTRNS